MLENFCLGHDDAGYYIDEHQDLSVKHSVKYAHKLCTSLLGICYIINNPPGLARAVNEPEGYYSYMISLVISWNYAAGINP